MSAGSGRPLAKTRYGWDKTEGDEDLKDRDLVPSPVVAHPDRMSA
ncbi:hypothetical protein [Ornithinicoccus halotolerans]|nr:hypothetical protein [Ornithinicoccus halotolerans]